MVVGLLNEWNNNRGFLHLYYGSKTTLEDSVLGQPEANVTLHFQAVLPYPIKLVSKEEGKLVLDV